MNKHDIIKTEKAPAPIGPYNQGVSYQSLVFISGQIPFDPQSNSLVEGDRATQIRRTFQNLTNIAESSGSSLNDCLKLTIFVLNLKDFDLINVTMKEFFSEPYPARSVVEVKSLPKSVPLEIDAILALSRK